MITHKNPKSIISNSDLQMAYLLLGWIVMVGLEVTLIHRHVEMYADNTTTVAWTENLLQIYISQQEDSFGD